MQSIMPLISAISTFFIVLFCSFFTVCSCYFMGQGELQFLAMPLKPSEIFTSKYLISLFSDIILGIVTLGTSSAIYGFNEGLLLNPLFYLGTILLLALIPVVAVFFIYVFLIFLFTICPFLRKRKFLQTLSIIFIVIFAVSMNYSNLLINKNIANFSVSVARYGFIEIFASVLSGNVISILIFALIIGLIIFVLVPAIAPFYIRTIYGFEDNSEHKQNKPVNLEVEKEIQSSSLFKTLFVRDIKSVLREPAFFSNGPLMIIIFPILFLVSFLVSFLTMDNTNLSDLSFKVSNFLLGLTEEKYNDVIFLTVMILSGVAVFLGSATNIASTSFSREGKFLINLKAMPINYSELIKAKFFHSMIYCVFAWFITSVFFALGILVLQLPIALVEVFEMIFFSFILSMSISIFLIFLEMFVDTANPKLLWENPTACVKQNLNALLVVFMCIVVILLVVLLGIFLIPKTMAGSLLMGLIFCVLSAVTGNAYIKYALKKLPVIQ